MLQKQRSELTRNTIVKQDSQLEDGSSGGEGTITKNIGGGSGENANASNYNSAPARQLNSCYLGDLNDAIDLEKFNFEDDNVPEFEVTDIRYTAMRLKCVFKLWPFIQDALNSPWSNIRSICYGLICSMLKIDVRDFHKYLPYLDDDDEEVNLDKIQKKYEDQDTDLLVENKFYQKLRHNVIPMMLSLLSSKESESKAGGLNILGSFCGLSYDFSKVKISKQLDFFKRNSVFVSLPIWQLVFDLQEDWDITIKEASIVLIQLCAPREAIQFFNKTKIDKENKYLQQTL